MAVEEDQAISGAPVTAGSGRDSTTITSSAQPRAAQPVTNTQPNLPLQSSAVAVKLPDFILERPELWLIQAEAQFSLARITSEETRWYHIISRLPADVIVKCADIIQLPFAAGSYAKLCEALKERYGPSTDVRMKNVLDNLIFQSGDRPSQFFRTILAEAGTLFDYPVVVRRFLQRMPPHVRTAITSLVNDLLSNYTDTTTRSAADERRMLAVADDIVDATPHEVHAVRNPPKQQKAQQNRSQPRNQNNNRHRSRSRARSGRNPQTQQPRAYNRRDFDPNGPWCRIHFRYGDEARFCSNEQRCTFPRRSEN